MNDKEVKVLNIEADPEGLGLLKVEYDSEILEIVYYIDNNDDWHIFYKSEKKPCDIDFEEKLMSCLGY